MESKESIIIETRNLTKKYGEKTAVNKLNLLIKEGEIFGLLGPNGAGKTTTILMLLGLTEPSSGRAFINGKNCTRNPIEVKSMVGYLPDHVGFYQDMTGRQNLVFTGKLNGLSDQEAVRRADDLLRRVGLVNAADQKTGTYSRGMKQRLGVADILMKDPQIIIMDEPTLGIDPEGMRELLQLMKELSKEDGRTLLISSHQLYQIQQVCDRVGIFVNGNLIACGKIEDLGKQVQKENHYTLELKVEPLDETILEEIRRQPGVSQVDTESDMLSVQSTTDIRGSLTAFLGSNGYTILHMHQRGGDLDEIYRLYFEKAGLSDENNRSKKQDRKHFVFPIRRKFREEES
ncbi:MAG: ABC transporter ATP-binding protein [Lachnospiraceae bacterium]